ncbi:MAG: serine hydroxymethyltransferase [Candidatus Paceibacterota bacterium]|jgi:glycine hydroxymethyltransferase
MLSDRPLARLLEEETKRQAEVLDLIASENYAPAGVYALLGSSLTNKYSEGYPGKRYYPGNEYCDAIELLAQERARAAFGLKKNWQVNVQAYSGAVANMAVYAALLKPGETMLAMDLSAGGHLSHGSPASLTGKLYRVVRYGVDAQYRIDYGAIERLAQENKPRIIVSGASAYPGSIDFKKIGAIAHRVGAYHLADIAHYAGLVATGVYPSPFPYADIVTTTTHKSLCGPRAALIFSNTTSRIARARDVVVGTAIDRAVFPGLQGGPHNNTIAALAHGLGLVHTAAFSRYAKRVIANATVLAAALRTRGFDVVGGGTESHLLLVRVTGLGLNGLEAEAILEQAGILANRNTIAGDTSPMRPSAIRVGTYAITTRGMGSRQMNDIADMMHALLREKKNPAFIAGQVKKLCKKFPVPALRMK